MARVTMAEGAGTDWEDVLRRRQQAITAPAPVVPTPVQPVAPVPAAPPVVPTPVPGVASVAPAPILPQPEPTMPSTLEGFDWTKLQNPAHTTPKYQFARVAQQYAPTPSGFAALVADPGFQTLGLQSIGNGRVRMPDGQIIDTIRGYATGGQAWQWLPVTGPGGAPLAPEAPVAPAPVGGAVTPSGTISPLSPAAVVPGTGVTPEGWPAPQIPGIGDAWTPTTEFTDPTTANFETILNSRIQELLGPVDDQSRSQYAGLLQQLVSSMSEADPALSAMVESLNQLAQYGQTPGQAEGLARPLATQFQTLPPEYEAAARARIGALQADPYTGAEFEMYRSNVLDPIERDRTAAIQRAMQSISDRGIDPSSGIGQALLREVNQAYDEDRAVGQRELGMARLQEREARQGQAFDIQTALQNLAQSRQVAGVDVASGADAAEQARRGLTAQTYATLSDIPQARAQQQLQAAASLSDLSGSLRGEEQNRRAEAVALQGLLAELPERRLQLALATLGQGEMPGSVMNSLLGIAGLNQQQQQFSSAQSQGMWQGLGSLLAYLSQNRAGGTTPGTYVGPW